MSKVHVHELGGLDVENAKPVFCRKRVLWMRCASKIQPEVMEGKNDYIINENYQHDYIT